MRAYVTGGRGFVGTWLSEHLRDLGDEVLATDQEVDITDAKAVADAVGECAPDAIYHLAGFTDVARSWEEPAEAMRVNAIGTLRVLEAARKCDPVPTVLVTSSAEIYGTVDGAHLPISESAPAAPVSPYAASKVAAEYVSLQAYLAYGLPVVRVRPFNHVGPGQSANFVVSALAARIIDAERSGDTSIRVGNLDARRDLTDVRDVVRAYRLLVQAGVPGDVYNVCSGRDVAVADVARRLIELVGVDIRLERDPALYRPVDIPVVQGDASRLRQVSGWVPEIDLDETLRDVLSFWRSRPASVGSR